MPHVLLFGDETALAGYASALEAQALSISQRLPGESDPLPENVDAVVLHLPSLTEDTRARQLIERAEAEDGAGLVLIVGPNHVAAFDPLRDADEFLLEGASADELTARVRRVLWRLQRHDSSNVLRCGELVMDFANYTVHIAGRPVELTFKEYELLRFLAVNRHRVFSREALLNNVWGYDFYGGARTVDVHIRRLRSKIEDRHTTFIETVRNVGYRFRGPA
ncbi:MAG: response regulator transcription factor [Chloroflexi bacterium]|nr:response regulator transcription factor [Chloroflexota bacterium]MCI0820088.1 response regulator transcription factor [Chloroflexota bacterium]MCI0883744.1 response regulator transcription factor [Chloroflexota bacterium]